MPDITDLDVLVPEPKVVRLGGVDYKIPADLPMEIFLRINLAATLKNEDGTDDQVKQLTALLDAMEELFTWEQPETDVEGNAKIKETVDHVIKRRGVRFAFELVKNIYSTEDEGAEDAVDPTVLAPEVVASNGTKSSSTSESPTTSPTTDQAAS